MQINKQVHLYGSIAKFDACDDGSLLVSGIASTECVDADGEIVTAEAMRSALPTYLQKGTVREMHQPLAAGVPISAFVDDEGRTHFTAKIVDLGTIAKIKAGVLKGFSIGGKAIKKVGNKITELLLRDISVVDIPNNPESLFSIIKFDKTEKTPSMKMCNHCDETMEKCGGNCSGAKNEKEKFEQVDKLTQTVDTLVKGFESFQNSLANQVPIKIKVGDSEMTVAEALSKTVTDLGDVQKRLSETQAANLDIERNSIISKMQSDGRVVIKDDGLAYTSEDLKKMDLSILKIVSKNAQILPLRARAAYTSTGTGPDEKELKGADGEPLTGSALVSKAWEGKYGDLSKMISESSTK